MRRFQIIHWFNHLHFFDPWHSFRKKLWTSTYLSFESYLPTSECCWCRDFVKMKIRDPQSLLVSPIILWESSLFRVEWISGWRSRLKSRIQDCVWNLTFILYMWWCVFRYVRNPRIEFSWITWRRRRSWICKNVSRYTLRIPNVWRLIVAASQSSWITIRWKWRRLTGNVGWSTAYWLGILKISRVIFIQLISFCNSIILAVSSSIVSRLSINLLLANSSIRDFWTLFNSSISWRLLIRVSRRSRFCSDSSFWCCSWSRLDCSHPVIV